MAAAVEGGMPLRVEMTLTIFRHTISAIDEKPIAVIRQVRSSMCDECSAKCEA